MLEFLNMDNPFVTIFAGYAAARLGASPMCDSADISSMDSTLFTSRMMTNLPVTLPMPLDEVGADLGAEARRRFDLGGRDLQHFGHRIHHHADIVLVRPAVTSMMTMQVRRVTAVLCRPKRADRSTTGTTAPRRLITPRMKSGHHRHLGQDAVLDDFLDVENADGEHLAAQQEGQVLVLSCFAAPPLPFPVSLLSVRP